MRTDPSQIESFLIIVIPVPHSSRILIGPTRTFPIIGNSCPHKYIGVFALSTPIFFHAFGRVHGGLFELEQDAGNKATEARTRDLSLHFSKCLLDDIEWSDCYDIEALWISPPRKLPFLSDNFWMDWRHNQEFIVVYEHVIEMKTETVE